MSAAGPPPVEPPKPAAPNPATARQISRGALWATVEVWGVELLQLLVFTLLARLLGPDAYGLVALAMAFVLVPQTLLVHGGWIEALVQRPDLTRAHVDSIFWLLAGLGLASLVALLAIAPWVEAQFAIPELAPLLAALAVCPFLTSLMVVPAGLLQRRLELAPLAVRSILGVGLGGAVAVALALAGAGPWALVANEIAWPLAGVLVLSLAARHRPRWGLSWRHCREIGRFALGITGAQLVALGELMLPRLLLGRLAGPVAVGHWGLARKLFNLAGELVSRPALRVALPGFARLREQGAGLTDALALAVELTALLSVPGFALLLVLGPDLLALAFGEAWRQAGEALRILAVLGPLIPFGQLLTSALQAAGRVDLVLVAAVLGAVLVLLLLVPLAASGVAGVAVAFALRDGLLAPLRLALVRRVLGVRVGVVLAPLPSILAAGAAMVASMLALRSLVEQPSGVALLAATVAAGAATYGAALLLVARPTLLRAARGLGRLRTAPAEAGGRERGGCGP